MLPRECSLLRSVRVDGPQRLIRQRAAEIVKEPPGDAVGAADDDAGRAHKRGQGRREIRQDLRLHREKYVIMNSELRRGSGARPTVARLAARLDPEALSTQGR